MSSSTLTKRELREQRRADDDHARCRERHSVAWLDAEQIPANCGCGHQR